MKDYQLAWKNLWRNRRRTIITAASVFFAVFFALVMRSFQLGAYDRMFKNVIESYTGYLQLQQRDYFDDPMLDNGFVLDDSLFDTIENDPNVLAIVPRLESFALAAAESRTQGVIVMGIDPDGEDIVSDIESRLVKYRLDSEAVEALKKENLSEHTKTLLEVFINEAYTGEGRLMLDLGIGEKDTLMVLPVLRRYASFENSFLEKGDMSGAVIGAGLSEYLGLSIGDTIVLMGQGYHGTTAAGEYAIRGIVKLPAPDIDNIIVYLPIEAAGELYAASGMATSAVIKLQSNDDRDIQSTLERLQRLAGDHLQIRDWRELNALLINQMEADNKSGMIMIAILYLVIAFGVFGTVLMMLAERRREFGMLISIGMQKSRLAGVIAMEMLFTGLLGVATGVAASLPLVFYGNIYPLRFKGELARMYEDYGFEPIMPTMLPDTYYLWQVVVVLIILAAAIFFSIRRIFRINVINAIRT